MKIYFSDSLLKRFNNLNITPFSHNASKEYFSGLKNKKKVLFYSLISEKYAKSSRRKNERKGEKKSYFENGSGKGGSDRRVCFSLSQ